MSDSSSHYGGCTCKKCNPKPHPQTFDSIEDAFNFNKVDEETEELIKKLKSEKPKG